MNSLTKPCPGSRNLARRHHRADAVKIRRSAILTQTAHGLKLDGCWLLLLTGVLRRSLGQGYRDHCDKDPESASQFSTARPGTRLNSRSLSVTSVASIASAWAAIQVSLAPIGVPLSSRPARTLA
jgi:hypothetical protein